MKKKYSYFLNVNGLYFGFNSARYEKDSFLWDRLNFYSKDKYICSLDLSVSKLKFKSINGDVIYFEIVSIGGVGND